MSEPETQRRFNLRGYEVTIRIGPNDAHITCPELPQLDVRDESITAALYLAGDAIDEIIAGEVTKRQRALRNRG